jgi:uncharacterized protein YdhG (YjbR/CyaY superfamily)
MEAENTSPQTIDEFIVKFPEEIQAILQKIRQIIHTAAPDAQETIKYGIPTFTLNGNLVHFSAYKHHVGFYPAPSGIEKFNQELALYKKSKGAIQFPLDQPIPYELIKQIVQYRVEENIEKAQAKQKKRK